MSTANISNPTHSHEHGKHDTTHHRNVASEVTNETVNPHQHEHVKRDIDREVHQDHHRTTEQPVYDKEVLPSTHEKRVHGTEERVFDNRNNDELKDTLGREHAKFKNERVVAPTVQSRSQGDDEVNEHVHHHVHETVKPVIYKETVQPHTVHTTKPVHETHHLPATHTKGGELPAMSMGEFKKHAGQTASQTAGTPESKINEREGCPPEVGHGHTGQTATSRNTRSSAQHNSAGVAGSHSDTKSSNNSNGPHKSSLMNKLDPRVDANGDGEAGFMK